MIVRNRKANHGHFCELEIRHYDIRREARRAAHSRRWFVRLRLIHRRDRLVYF
jgi:hypothetical protein